LGSHQYNGTSPVDFSASPNHSFSAKIGLAFTSIVKLHPGILICYGKQISGVLYSWVTNILRLSCVAKNKWICKCFKNVLDNNGGHNKFSLIIHITMKSVKIVRSKYLGYNSSQIMDCEVYAIGKAIAKTSVYRSM